MSEFQCALNVASPAKPPVNALSLYAKADGLWYYQDSAGVELRLTGVHHTTRTAGTGAAGTTDTYTTWGDAAGTISLGTFTVLNGIQGLQGIQGPAGIQGNTGPTGPAGSVTPDVNGELTQNLAGAAAQVSSGIPEAVKQADGTWKDINTRVIPSISQALPIPAASIVAHDFFDNTGDSAWIDRCADKSWENEHVSLGRQYLAANYANDAAAIAANPTIVNGDVYYNGTVFNEYGLGATTRGSSRKFPMRGVVTAEAGRAIIWDITSGQAEMWMVWRSASGTGWHFWLLGNTATSIAFSGSKLIVGTNIANSNAGLLFMDFTSERMGRYGGSGNSGYTSLPGISNRNDGGSLSNIDNILPHLVNNAVNDVAITFLPDAPLDEYGMKIPTIAVATVGDTSIINNDGSVVNHTNSWIGSAGTQHVAFAPDGSLITVEHSIISGGATGVRIHPVDSFLLPSVDYTNGIVEFTNNTTPSLKFSGATIQSIIPNSYATSSGFVLHRNNPSSPANGMVAYLTNTYNTGYMVGDIRRAISYNSNAILADRSVKASVGVVEVGSLTKTTSVGGRTSISGFSATNYIQEPSHADWNAIGTGDFSITMTGVKWGASGIGRMIFNAGASLIGDAPSTGSIELQIIASNKLLFAIHNGANFNAHSILTSVSYSGLGSHDLTITRTGGALYIYIDGNSQAVTVIGSPQTRSISCGVGVLRLGQGQGIVSGAPWAGGAFETFNISATATSPEQAKFIAVQEKAIQGGKPCLLSSSSSVTSLAYDKKHDTYYAENGTNTDEFKGLQRIDSAVTSTGITTSGNALAAPVLMGNVLKAPAIDINSELTATIKPPRVVFKKLTSDASSVLTFPRGFKPVRITSSGGTYISLSTNVPKYDGFLYSITTGLVLNTNYDVEMLEVTQ